MKNERVYEYIRNIERLFIEDKLLDTDYYRLYEKLLAKEDLEYMIDIGLNSKNGNLIREHLNNLDKCFKS